jgi:prepilin-type N-terminal cleavage/methylation domain-containing protein
MFLRKKYSHTRSATSNGMNNRKKALVPYESNVFNMNNSARCFKYSARYFRTGFGLIELLITLAIIALAGWTTYSSFLKPNNGSETPLEQGISAINEAEKAKQLLEQRNIATPDSSEKNTLSTTPPKISQASLVSSWSVYQNSKYKFKISYPPTWELRESPDSTASGTPIVGFFTTHSYLDPYGGNEITNEYGIKISINSNPNQLSSQKYAQQYIDDANKESEQTGIGGLRFNKAQSGYIGSYNIYELDDIFDYDSSFDKIFLAYGESIFIFDYPHPYPDEATSTGAQAIYETERQIVNTFRFL